MEILFCDLCNESVPQSDLEAQRAYYRKGRLICRDCDAAMGGGGDVVPDVLPVSLDGPTRAPRTENAHAARPVWRGVEHEALPAAGGGGGGGGAGGVVLGLLALAFAGTSAWLLVQRQEGLERDLSAQRLALAGALEDLVDDQRALADDVAARFTAAEGGAVEREAAAAAALDVRLAELKGELAGFTQREDAVASALTALDQRITSSDGRTDEKVAALRATLDTLASDQRFYGDRLIEFEESLRLLSSGRPVVGASVPLPGGAVQAPPAATKPWVSLVPDLENDNPGIRLDAIYKLGETKDLGVAPHLIPMLKDEDLFVRMATARMLEDLGAKQAAPALIDALEDEQSPVRDAAIVALRALTGEDYGFEPSAPPAERAKRVKEWREWWKKNGEGFLQGE